MTQKTENAIDKKELLRIDLCNQIMSMQLLPNAMIDELALEKQFGLSRSPIREIIRQLAAEGFIELEQNRPARVAPMDYSSVRMFFQAAPLIYIATTKLAALSADPDGVNELKKIQTALKLEVENRDTVQCMLLNNRFHLQIGIMANNIYLLPSLKRLLIDHARLSMTFYRMSEKSEFTQERMEAIEQHDSIIQAIEEGDAERAAELIQAHWDLSKQRMMDFVMPGNLSIPIHF